MELKYNNQQYIFVIIVFFTAKKVVTKLHSPQDNCHLKLIWVASSDTTMM